MKEIKYELTGEILITPCPYKKKHGVGLDVIMVGSDQCKECENCKGYHGTNVNEKIVCNYEDTK